MQNAFPTKVAVTFDVYIRCCFIVLAKAEKSGFLDTSPNHINTVKLSCNFLFDSFTKCEIRQNKLDCTTRNYDAIRKRFLLAGERPLLTRFSILIGLPCMQMDSLKSHR